MQLSRLSRFSLSFLFLLLTTVGIWFGAYRHAYRTGDNAWRYNDERTMAYDVHDLVTPASPSPTELQGDASEAQRPTADAGPLLEVLEASVAASATAADETPPRIIFYPTNLSVIVSGTGRSHRHVTEAIAALRSQP